MYSRYTMAFPGSAAGQGSVLPLAPPTSWSYHRRPMHIRSVQHVAAATILAGAAAATTVRAQTAPTPTTVRAAGLRVIVTLPGRPAALPRDGRLLLIVSTDSTGEPRLQMSDHDNTQQMFGIDVHGLNASHPGVFDTRVFGYPRTSLADIPRGDYWVQAVLHPYETYRLSDGHTVELPPDRGEGQQWDRAPGSPMSRPKKVHLDPRAGGEIHIALDTVVPPLADIPDTKYVKHIRLQSERLTKFWGRPTFISAILVLPEGFDTHPDAHYPLAIYQGHFQRNPPDWREEPADQSLPAPDTVKIAHDCPNSSDRGKCDRGALTRLSQQVSYDYYKRWTGPNYPRVILVTIQHANPYYDDSYAVNSENVGPYGDAITYELIPAIEQRFRGIGPWARALYGGSTGGWEALGVQVLYPDQYNGTYAACPDPIDFRQYTNFDIYTAHSAYYTEGPWRRTPRAGERDDNGDMLSTVEQQNLRELVEGTHSRSGGQWDIWEAVFSPVGPDGYPRRIYDKRTGAIDPTTAAYWRDHYDLVHIMQRDWPTLGPKLQGKIHIDAGMSDSWFLNDAVYLADDFFKSTTNPHSDAEIVYGPRHEHCFTGDPDHVNTISGLTFTQRTIPQMVAHWLATAPSGADTTSWRY
jgi:hypothetical protein